MKMTKKLYIFATAMVAMAMASCSDMGEKNLYDPDLQDEVRKQEYNNAFINEFGEIPANQKWDFYASAIQEIQGTTRADGEVVVTPIPQPTDMDFSEWQSMLAEDTDNSNVGTRDFTLISNGPFKMYAVWFAGVYEAFPQYRFEMGVVVDGEYKKVFDGKNKDRDLDPEFCFNPEFGAIVDIPKGKSFQFYIKYEALQHIFFGYSGPGTSSTEFGPAWSTLKSYGNASLLYSDNITEGKRTMVVGFEDKMRMDWTTNGGTQVPDCNDIILYIEGHPSLPVPESKRFLCEDLGAIGDFDFNDVVVDVQPGLDDNKAAITLHAAGGTMPINLYIAGQDLGEVHELLGVEKNVMVNTRPGGLTAAPYHTEITVPDDFNLTMFNDVKLLVTKGDGSQYWINYSADGSAPSLIATPMETKWMKETVNIKKGYPSFFTTKWYENSDPEFLY